MTTIRLDKYDFLKTQHVSHETGRIKYTEEVVVMSGNVDVQNTLIKARDTGHELHVISDLANIDTFMVVTAISLEGYDDHMIINATLMAKGE